MPLHLMADDAPPLVLASGSAARASMLKAVGLPIEICPPTVDEGEIKASFKAAGASPGDVAIALAELKAQQVARRLPPSPITLGADQMLSCDGSWYDKPDDRQHARQQLEALGGKQHTLHTAVVGFRGGGRIWHHLAETTLWMRPLSPSFLDRYIDIAGDALMTTVGGYQIEGMGAQLFSKIEGDYHAILGMPLIATLAFLRDQGVLIR